MPPLDPEAFSPPSPRTSRGEGRGEGRPYTPEQASAPHPNPLPTAEWGAETHATPGAPGPSPFAAPAAHRPARVSDARDAAGAIWQDGAFRRDAWVRAVDGKALPDAPAIVGKRRWLAERDALAGRNAPLGLHLDAGEGVDDIAADLARFALIALNFPKFSDGRAFSTARLLRDKHGYRAELRAVGNVLSDQIPFMRRVGFDAFEVSHAPTRRALQEGRIPEVTLHYQPAGADEPPAATRPWLRRRTGG
jgi:uncharacterized protein (DUF934 family)